MEDSAHTREKNYKVVKMLEMNIDTLLQAAEYIERRERGELLTIICLIFYVIIAKFLFVM